MPTDDVQSGHSSPSKSSFFHHLGSTVHPQVSTQWTLKGVSQDQFEFEMYFKLLWPPASYPAIFR
jgi:hypothetical protein